MKKPSAPINTSRPAAATPRIDETKKIRQKTCARSPPSVAAAIDMRRSIWFITGNIVTTASGNSVWLDREDHRGAIEQQPVATGQAQCMHDVGNEAIASEQDQPRENS